MNKGRLGLFVTLAVVAGLASVAPALADATHRDGYLRVAGLFGESDEEKAARLAAEQRENDQDAGIAELRQRVGDLEKMLPQITGQNEALNHRLQEMQAALDKQKKDFDYKLCSLTGQLMGVGTAADSGGIDCAAGGVAIASAAGQNNPTLAVQQEYDSAMGLLARAQYDEARAAFSAFVDAHPKDELAAHAVYWVGNIAYVQKDYAAAAKAFATGLKNYAKSPRAPESMFKLGQTLIAIGQQKEGCLTLGAVKSKYPKAPPDVLNQAARTHAASCK
jgi:tol-pal system protein YbgF